MTYQQLIAQRQQQREGHPSKTVSVPAPIGGLNAKDALASMPPTDAVLLDNWFPEPSDCVLREGSSNWATGLPAWVESLFDYRGVSHKIFAMSNTGMYDVTSAGAVGAAVVSGLTNARWEALNMGTAGGQYLYAFNATDKPILYDGTNYIRIDGSSTPAITGVTTTKLRSPALWKNRLWVIEDGTTNAWYLPTGSVGGAANSIILGPYLTLGGTLQAIIPITLASGSNYDDYLGFLSSEGELVLYQGTDPATAGLFNIQGRYRMGRPIGRRSWFRFGSDVIVICADGFQSMAKLINQGRIGSATTLSEKILNDVTSDVQSFSGNFGWQGVLFPTGNKVLINVPAVENTSQYQYVLNTITGAWCTFGKFNSPWNAATFLVSEDNLYYGGNGVVVLADTGQSDNGNTIVGSVVPAFNYFGSSDQKQLTMVRPIMATTGSINGILSCCSDFAITQPTGTPTFTGSTGAVWDAAPWNVSDWGTGFLIQKLWQHAPGYGFALSVYFVIQSNVTQCRLMSFDYLVNKGGTL